MLEFLEGPVVEQGEDFLVLGLGGIGVRVMVPPRTVAESSGRAAVRLCTYLLFKEDGVEVYGFATQEEREMFVGLLSVPKVGPKLAFKLVAALPPTEFIQALRQGDLSALDQIKGIGRRTAQRVMMELSERLAKIAPPVPTPLGEKETIVLRALTGKALGFTEAEARKALSQLRRECPDAPVEEMIRRALALLSGS